MLTLGIETSCDETAAAVLGPDGGVLSNVVHSQIPIHAKYGGVVPELASRNHVMAAVPVVAQALQEADVKAESLDLVAVTVGPGLVGSLLVGVETAKMLAYIHDHPLIGVHHIEGHILSPFADPECRLRLELPYIALIVSGGHTSIILAQGPGAYQCIGRTLDDAAGEAFDKVAKRLGGPYPGGPYIEEMAKSGDPARCPMPRPMLKAGYDFSFSGLKTAAANRISKLEAADPDRGWLPDLCAGVQDAIVAVLLHKAFRAAESFDRRTVVIAGGVACNGALRRTATEEGAKRGISIVIPPPLLCTDNAAMIAVAGRAAFRRSPSSGFNQAHLDADVSLEL